MTKTCRTLAVLGCALGLAAAPAAAHVNLQANLDAVQEVPPPTVVGTPTATATLVLENDNTIAYQITPSGLSGAPIFAHIHNGQPGTAGPVIITLDHTTLMGVTLALTDDQLRALFAGDLYVNLHTAANVAGEVRGQIVPPAPTCDCDALTPKQWKRCVKQALAALEKDERTSAAGKQLKKVAVKASCGKTKGPKKAIACCLPMTPFENIATDALCAAVPPKACTKLGGLGARSKGEGTSCFTGAGCASPLGALVDGPALF